MRETIELKPWIHLVKSAICSKQQEVYNCAKLEIINLQTIKESTGTYMSGFQPRKSLLKNLTQNHHLIQACLIEQYYKMRWKSICLIFSLHVIHDYNISITYFPPYTSICMFQQFNSPIEECWRHEPLRYGFQDSTHKLLQFPDDCGKFYMLSARVDQL